MKRGMTGGGRRGRSLAGLVSGLGMLLLIGCSESPPSSGVAAPPVMTAAGESSYRVTPSELRRQLKANELARFETSGTEIVGAKLFRSGVKSIEPLRDLPLETIDLGMTVVDDLSPLEGMPLREVVLENTPVSDLSPLQGMSLEVLKLQNTRVTDLSPIAGMPLRQLNLMGVPVSDLEIVQSMPLDTLWIPRTQVDDLSPLVTLRLVSLDVEGTDVADLTPLSKMTSLKRLNIAGTPVTDLTPLADLSLERITLTPSSIARGIDTIRGMSSLTHIQTSMEMPTTAEEFWKRYDLDLYAEPATDVPAGETEGQPEGDSPDDAATESESNEDGAADSDAAVDSAESAERPENPESAGDGGVL